MTTPTQGATGFDGLGLAPKLLASLKKHRFTEPTPIQSKSIPIAVEGKDVIGIAQTGTGKTLAFGLPMIQRIPQVNGRGLVILPTRELALQVDESLQRIGRELGLRTAILIGGASMRPQLDALKRNPHIIIATPGRLIDHMEQKTVDLSRVRILVLDEADRMLDMGFEPQIRKILARVPAERQTMLFSATMPDQIVDIAKRSMKLPLRIEVAPAGSTAERVEQELFFVRREDKPRLLEKLLKETQGTVLVFSRTKHGASKITRNLKHGGHRAAEIHSDRTLGQRRRALEGFKTGEFRILVATDIAARGIDVTGISLVVNYDLPQQAEDYVHRIGRTARAGREGKAISFAQPDQRKEVKIIESLIRKALPVRELPGDLPPALPPAPYTAPRQDDRFGRRSQGRGYDKRGGRSQRDERRTQKPSGPQTFQGAKRFQPLKLKRTWN